MAVVIDKPKKPLRERIAIARWRRNKLRGETQRIPGLDDRLDDVIALDRDREKPAPHAG